MTCTCSDLTPQYIIELKKKTLQRNSQKTENFWAEMEDGLKKNYRST